MTPSQNRLLAKLALTILMMVDGSITQFASPQSQVQVSGVIPVEPASKTKIRVAELILPSSIIAGLRYSPISGLRHRPASTSRKNWGSATPQDDEVAGPTEASESMSPDDTLDLRQRRLKCIPTTVFVALILPISGIDGRSAENSSAPRPMPTPCALRARSVAIRC